CRFKVSKAMQRILALLSSSMVLFSLSIEIGIGPMSNSISHNFSYCTWIRTMSIRCDMLWDVTTDLKGLREELLGCLHIALFAEPRIDQIAISINGSIQGAPLSMNACP